MSSDIRPVRLLRDLLSRRVFFGVGAFAATAAAAGRRAFAQSSQESKRGEHNASASDPGPENAALKSVNPDGFVPPPTDHGSVPDFWHSFSVVHRRVQDGGWSRQVNVEDFPISKELAGVNMKLSDRSA